MVITQSKNKIKQVKEGDRLWLIRNGLYLTPRAGFEINNSCPREYKLVLQECMANGWLKPVAYMRDDEYTWESLKE
jgi:hypothetical protein